MDGGEFLEKVAVLLLHLKIQLFQLGLEGDSCVDVVQVFPNCRDDGGGVCSSCWDLGQFRSEGVGELGALEQHFVSHLSLTAGRTYITGSCVGGLPFWMWYRGHH